MTLTSGLSPSFAAALAERVAHAEDRLRAALDGDDHEEIALRLGELEDLRAVAARAA